MNFIAYLFWNHLISCRTERILWDGKEEECLIIPAKINQMKRGKSGNWYSIFRLAECPPNAEMRTHDIQMTYVNPDDLQKSYDFEYHNRTAHMGRVYEHDRTPEKKIDRTNNATDIRLDGIIVLSDIPQKLIYRNELTGKRYISNLMFRAIQDDGIVYQGSLCIDDIDVKSIVTDPNTGKKKINVRLQKTQMMDVYYNTHELVMVKDDGSECQIGLFREFHAIDVKNPPNPNASKNIHNTQVNQRQTPSEINGIKF